MIKHLKARSININLEDELILYAEGEESNCIHLRTTNSIMKCTIIEQKTRRIKVNIENEYEGIYKYFHVTTVGVVRKKMMEVSSLITLIYLIFILDTLL